MDFNKGLQAVTGSEYSFVQYGKPTVETYKYAEEMLQARVQELYGEDAQISQQV